MKTAPSSANANGGQWIVARSPCASAVPTSTGVTAAASVFGRAARSQGVIGVPQKPSAKPPARPCESNRPSRESRELLEIGLPLFHICVPPFLRLLGQVI